jgi:hypothetical protein
MEAWGAGRFSEASLIEDGSGVWKTGPERSVHKVMNATQRKLMGR